MPHGDHTPAVPEEPIANPGLPAHQWRPTDVDERAEKRAERQVAAMFGLSMVCAVLFVVAYFTLEIGDNFDTFIGLGASTVALGAHPRCCALLLIGIGIIQWARKLMSDHEIVEMRHPAASSEEDRAATLEALSLGTEESGIARRPLVRNTLLGAVGLLGLPGRRAAARPRPRPTPGRRRREGLASSTPSGRRACASCATSSARPSRPPSSRSATSSTPLPRRCSPPRRTATPRSRASRSRSRRPRARSSSSRWSPATSSRSTGRENWTVNGIICYSKICTHVGCPISLYERTTHHVLCPCHQSTFDLADSAKVVFGPAHRPLPQLPLAVDDEGYLIAQSDFTEPIGASYWEREKQ